MGLVKNFFMGIFSNFLNDEKKLINAMSQRNSKKFVSIIKNASKKKKNIDLNNIKDDDDQYPLYWGIDIGNIEIIESLIKYANNHGVILELDKKVKNGNFPLLEAIKNDKFEIIELLMKYADENKIILDLNEKDDDGEYPILLAVYKGIKYVKLLIDYADKHEIMLKMNDLNKVKRYPLLMATFWNNIEVVQYLIKYASKNGLVLDLNRKGENDSSNYSTPVLNAINHGNIEMVHILVDYSKSQNINIEINESDIKNIQDIRAYKELSEHEREIEFESFNNNIAIIMALLKINIDGIPLGKSTRIAYREADLPVYIYTEIWYYNNDVQAFINIYELLGEMEGGLQSIVPFELSAAVVNDTVIMDAKLNKEILHRINFEFKGVYDPMIKTGFVLITKEDIKRKNILRLRPSYLGSRMLGRA